MIHYILFNCIGWFLVFAIGCIFNVMNEHPDKELKIFSIFWILVSAFMFELSVYLFITL